ncbi:MAG: hypothetical protein KJO21_00635 [Verrucomicrobiae bacterium]|nr:hypothetical protein [Verrucomicrobiae bacterium]NNJ42039.1 hypothetical protein [Akkermansiaceae bacterium]
MIELTMEEFMLWVIGVPILVIGFYGIIAGLKRRAAIRTAQSQIVCCRVCGHLYRDRSRERSPQCPGCGRANHRGESRRLG